VWGPQILILNHENAVFWRIPSYRFLLRIKIECISVRKGLSTRVQNHIPPSMYPSQVFFTWLHSHWSGEKRNWQRMKSRRCATRKQTKKERNRRAETASATYECCNSISNLDSCNSISNLDCCNSISNLDSCNSISNLDCCNSRWDEKTQREEKNLLVRSRLHFLFHRQTSRQPKPTFVSWLFLLS